ncbi:MotE family protein [Bacillus sp. FJAT-29790]|uniref:MotE family protein n=1 Tax=Bacillus sp. FJAT-29790 TaxID=1895002 RepID=UPI001C241ACA|nr:MotE family protein [Bacillus sp. FJAT-29790]MBU8877833.1 MotE family protein [Bacillus sp. FJAT-29790]
MDKVLEEKESKKYTKFQSFILIVFIPLLFAITVALIAMTILGYNVFEITKEYSQKIPFISTEEKTQSVEELETKMIELEAEIKDREAKISQLETKLDSKDQEISKAQKERERLEEEIDELTAMKEENKRAFKDIVKTYETISAKKAAPIISQMSEPEAIKILSNLKAATLAGIMEKMDPKDAARFTELLTVEKENNALNSP